MPQIAYSRERRVEESTIERAAISRRGPIKIRIQPQVLLRKPGLDRDLYYAWKGVHWTITCGTVQEVYDMRSAMERLFKALDVAGNVQVLSVLDRLIAVRVESAANSGR